MTRLITLVAIGLSNLALASAVSAETFKAAFNYNSEISAEANYDTFQKIARKACKTEGKTTGGILAKKTVEAECNTRLMNDAVSATARAELTELHKLKTGAQPQILATAR